LKIEESDATDKSGGWRSGFAAFFSLHE